MAKGFKHGAGGGTSLNFKIIGNPQPETAKENTIWLDTDVEITSWDFSATEPENPAEGMVWLITDTSSTAAFNALKKNGIQVYPLSAKQYVSGAWVDVTAKSWQGGAWVQWWDGELYVSGKEYESVTGGWITTGSVTKNETDIYIRAPENSSSKCTTKNLVDLTEFETLVINVTSAASTVAVDGGRQMLRILNASGSSVASVGLAATGKRSLNISSLSGGYQIQVYLFSSATGYVYSNRFDEIRLYR